MRITKWALLVLILLQLAACGSGEQHLRSIVNEFEIDFAEQMNDYADFEPQQKQQINQFSKAVALWFRQQRLPSLQRILKDIRKNIQNNRVIDQETYFALFDFLGNPFSFVESDALMPHLAKIAYSLTDEQVIQIKESLDKNISTLEEEAKTTSVAKGNKKIVRVLQFIFRDLGVGLTTNQREYLTQALSPRHASEMQIVDAERRWNQQLIATLATRKRDREQFQSEFIDLWLQSDNLHKNANQEVWQYNRQLMAQTLSGLISSFSQKDRNRLASRLQDYIDLLAELTVPATPKRAATIKMH